jgi:O-antigen/teichoic acid export membrane protein
MIKKIFNNNIVKNYYSTAILQFLNYVIPFLLIPYIVRILGAEKYGLVNFAQNFVAYFVLIVSYGFDYTATRLIAVHQDNNKEVSRVFWITNYSKLFLFCVSFFIFLISILSFTKLKENQNLFIASFLGCVGFLFTPNWLYQGLNKVPILNKITLGVKSLFYLLLFVSLKQKEQYILVPIILGIAQILTGFFSFYIAIKKFELSYFQLKFVIILAYLREGFNIFISTIVVNLYTATNVVLIGFLGTAKATGLFSANSKIVTILIVCMFMPLSQVLYPHIAKELSLDKVKGIEVLSIAFYLVLIFGFLCSLSLIVFAPQILNIMFGDEFKDAYLSLIILGFLPFLIAVGNCFAIQGLLNLKYDNWFLIITSVGAVICIVLNTILIKPYQEIGVSIAWITTESFITLSSGLVLYFKNINFWQTKPFITLVKKYV